MTKIIFDEMIDIWDEAPEVNTNVVFIEDEGPSADGELPIRGGTLNQIIKRLTNENKPGNFLLFFIYASGETGLISSLLFPFSFFPQSYDL